MKNNVAEIVTKRIIDEMSKGKIPWKKPWLSTLPKNYISKKEYRGINFLLLSLFNFKDAYFITFKQANNLGGTIKKGEKSIPIIYWNIIEEKNEDTGKKETRAFMRYYNVFNISQCDGIDFKVEKKYNHKKDSNYEEVFNNYKDSPKLVFGNEAKYNPGSDIVTIPKIETFKNKLDYYSTLYHELIHSTGSQTRLKRFNEVNTSSYSYGKEELVAELGAAFLCARYGIDNSQVKYSASYIQGWLRQIKNDPRLIISCAGKAQKAVDYIVGTIKTSN